MVGSPAAEEVICTRCASSGHLARACQVSPFLCKKTAFELRIERARSLLAHNARIAKKAKKAIEVSAAQERKLKRISCVGGETWADQRSHGEQFLEQSKI